MSQWFSTLPFKQSTVLFFLDSHHTTAFSFVFGFSPLLGTLHKPLELISFPENPGEQRMHLSFECHEKRNVPSKRVKNSRRDETSYAYWHALFQSKQLIFVKKLLGRDWSSKCWRLRKFKAPKLISWSINFTTYHFDNGAYRRWRKTWNNDSYEKKLCKIRFLNSAGLRSRIWTTH